MRIFCERSITFYDGITTAGKTFNISCSHEFMKVLI